jgi:hypothetical protein
LSDRRAKLVAHDSLPASVLVHLADALSVPDGGFSVSVEHWRDARTGYAVSVFPECEERISGPLVPARIARYLSARAPLLARPDVVLGGWRNPEDGTTYLDVSIVVPTRAQAIVLAEENSQVAIWDFAACKSIPLQTTETRSRRRPAIGQPRRTASTGSLSSSVSRSAPGLSRHLKAGRSHQETTSEV